MDRLHGLDLLRAIAMLMGIVFHAPLLYFDQEAWFQSRAFLGFPEEPQPQSIYVLWAIFIFIHLWRMPVFFMLAGFFAAMTLERKGVPYFLKDRGLRITATLFVFMLIFPNVVDIAYGRFDHLWFLWHLTVFSVLFALWHWLNGPRLALRPGHLVAALPVVMVMALVFRQDQLHQPLEIDIRAPGNIIAMAYYLPFYVIGIGIWNGKATMRALATTPLIVGWLAVGFVGSVVILADPDIGLSFMPRAVASGAMTFGLSLGFMGLAQRVLTQRNAIVDWLVEGSYPIFVFHFYPIVLIAAITHAYGVPQFGVFAITVVGGSLVSVLQWYLFVRWTPLDILMNGPKRSRFLRLWRKYRGQSSA